MATPAVSVVVPSFRRPERIRACVQALAEQDLPGEPYEVVVVDDGSPEPLAPHLADLAGRVPLTVHRQPNAGPAAARNTGAGLARGALLAFTDDDCAPDPGWLRALLAAHRAHPEALLGGRIVNVLADDLFAEASQQLVGALYAWYDDDHRSRFFASNNLAAPRERLVALGAFDTGFPQPGGEDRELCERWAAAGLPLREVPDAVVRHAHGMDLRGFLRQHTNYGRGAYQLHRKRLAGTGDGVRVESARFYAHLLRHPFRSLPAGRAAAASALIAAAQVANAAGFLAERQRQRRARRPA
jgi:glycosyltransferase involved in cell wall biosynthesis